MFPSITLKVAMSHQCVAFLNSSNPLPLQHLNDIRDVTKRFFVGQKLKATVRRYVILCLTFCAVPTIYEYLWLPSFIFLTILCGIVCHISTEICVEYFYFPHDSCH